jgi:hypothetical protein
MNRTSDVEIATGRARRVEGGSESPHPRRRVILGRGLGLVLAVAPLCGMAYFLANAGCRGDGSFNYADALQSGYCKATHFPGVPDSPGSAIVVGVVYLMPIVLATVGAAAAVLTNERFVLRASAVAALTLTLIALCLVFFSHVSYPPAG